MSQEIVEAENNRVFSPLVIEVFLVINSGVLLGVPGCSQVHEVPLFVYNVLLCPWSVLVDEHM